MTSDKHSSLLVWSFSDEENFETLKAVCRQWSPLPEAVSGGSGLLQGRVSTRGWRIQTV